jgi:uncharacterized protein (DUF2062 family)
VIFAATLMASAPGVAAAPAIVVQAQPRPESFFWTGVLTALVPVLILGALGALVIHLYLRERRSREAERRRRAEERHSTLRGP